MITISIDPVKPSGGTAPYTFVYSSTDPTVAFSNATGTATLVGTEYRCPTDVIYLTQSSIDTAIIQCTITDAKGCTTTHSPVVVNNPCNLQNTITTNGEFVFVATTTGGSGTYTYEWIYDTGIFQPIGNVDETDNQISFRLLDTTTTTLVQCVVTDSNGCSTTTSYSYNICRPTWGATRGMTLRCVENTTLTGCSLVPTSIYNNFPLDGLIKPCANQVIDWTTLEFSNTSGLCIVNHNNGKISGASSNPNGVGYLVTISVKTTSGIKSQDLQLIVTAPICVADDPVVAINNSFQITANESIGSVINLNSSNRVAGKSIDWGTLQITTAPTFGTATINPNGDILYTITDLVTTPNVPDIIKWKIGSTTGYMAYGTDTILRDALAAPTTTTEIICAKCQESTPAFDLTANDTGDIDKQSVTIVLNDPDVIITKDSNHDFVFTTLPTASFNNLNTYKVANTQGVYSANQNFIVRSACVGEDKTPTNDLTCKVSKTFDLIDMFANMNAFNVSYTETTTTTPTYTTQGGTIVGANGTLDFSAIATDRTYTFEVLAENQGTCHPTYSDTGVVTVIHGVTPNIVLSAATLVSTGIYSFTFTYSGISSPFTITDDGIAATFHSGIVANNGTGSFSIYADPASSIVISATTVCGNITTSTSTT